MKVRTHIMGQAYREMDLAKYLEPCNTGSTQGTVEQLEAEVEVLKATMGRLLAFMVEHQGVTLGQATQISGMHWSYSQYKHGEVTLVP